MAKKKGEKPTTKTPAIPELSDDVASELESEDVTPVEVPRFKEYRGQKFVNTKTKAEVAQELEEKARAKKDATVVSIDAYFSMKNIRNPVMCAAMKAYTKKRYATFAEFEKVFETF